MNFSWIYPYKNYLELEREECICVNQYFKVYFEVQTFRFRKQMNSIEIQTRVNKKTQTLILTVYFTKCLPTKKLVKYLLTFQLKYQKQVFLQQKTLDK